jgi:hypothetical protein
MQKMTVLFDEFGFRYFDELPETAILVNMEQFKTHIIEKKYYLIKSPRSGKYELYKYHGKIDNDLIWFIENSYVYISTKNGNSRM